MANVGIKEKLKTKIPLLEKLSVSRRQKKAKQNMEGNFETYKETFFKYSSSGMVESNDPAYLRMKIIIGSHILEKGLCHSDYRPGFGKQSVIDMQLYLKIYLSTPDPDRFAIENAVSLLREYHAANTKHEFDDSDYLFIDQFEDIGIKQVSPYLIHVEAAKEVDTFRLFANKRHSVRVYETDGLPISSSLLRDVISIANTAPSACNRQATHVFAVTNREVIKQVEKIHGGCKGFGEHVSAFLFITSDLSLYSSNEVKLPIYDAGIYAMNLLYALQSFGLYSCALNGSFPGDATNMIHHVTGIPDKYDINGLVAVYNLPSKTEVMIAASPRREADDVLTFL